MKSLFFVFLAVACLNFASMAQTVSVQPSVSVIRLAVHTSSVKKAPTRLATPPDLEAAAVPVPA